MQSPRSLPASGPPLSSSSSRLSKIKHRLTSSSSPRHVHHSSSSSYISVPQSFHSKSLSSTSSVSTNANPKLSSDAGSTSIHPSNNGRYGSKCFGEQPGNNSVGTGRLPPAPQNSDDFVFSDPSLRFDTSEHVDSGTHPAREQGFSDTQSLPEPDEDINAYHPEHFVTIGETPEMDHLDSSSDSGASFENKPRKFTKLKVYSDDEEDDSEDYFQSSDDEDTKQQHGSKKLSASESQYFQNNKIVISQNTESVEDLPPSNIGEQKTPARTADATLLHIMDNLNIQPKVISGPPKQVLEHDKEKQRAHTKDSDLSKSPRVQNFDSDIKSIDSNYSKTHHIPLSSHLHSLQHNNHKGHEIQSRGSNLTLTLTKSRSSTNGNENTNANSSRSLSNASRLKLVSGDKSASSINNNLALQPKENTKEDLASMYSHNHSVGDRLKSSSKFDVSSIKTSNSSFVALVNDPNLCLVNDLNNQFSNENVLSIDDYNRLMGRDARLGNDILDFGDSSSPHSNASDGLTFDDYKDFEEFDLFSTKLTVAKELAFFYKNELPEETLLYPKYFLFKVINSKKRCVIIDKANNSSFSTAYNAFKMCGEFLSANTFIPQNIWKFALISIKDCRIKENILNELVNFLNGFWEKIYFESFNSINFKQINASLLYYKKLLSAFNVYESGDNVSQSDSVLSPAYSSKGFDDSLFSDDKREPYEAAPGDNSAYNSQMSNHIKKSIHSQRTNYYNTKNSKTNETLGSGSGNSGRSKHKRFSSFHFYKKSKFMSLLDLNGSTPSVNSAGSSTNEYNYPTNGSNEHGSSSSTNNLRPTDTGDNTQIGTNADSRSSLAINNNNNSAAAANSFDNAVTSPANSVLSFATQQDMLINNEDKKSYLRAVNSLFEIVCKLSNFAMFTKYKLSKARDLDDENIEDNQNKVSAIEQLMKFLSKFVIKFILIDVINLANDYMRFGSDGLRNGLPTALQGALPVNTESALVLQYN